MATNVKNIKRIFSLITSLILILSILLIPIQNADKISAYVSYSVTYKAGDYSDITGNSEVTFTGRLGGGVFDLPDPKRFSRLGYEITGWYCEHDGNIYKPYGQYKMPNQNVTFTAVWIASTYKISFTSNNSNRDTIYVTGTVGEYISMPECTFTYNGYEFAGWTYGGEVYQSGESFLVPGVMSGLALSIKATWIKASETTPAVTTTTSIEYTTTEYTTTEYTTTEYTTTEYTTTEYTTTEFTTTEFTTTEFTTTEFTTTEFTTTEFTTTEFTTTEFTTTEFTTTEFTATEFTTTEFTTNPTVTNQKEFVFNTILNYSLDSKMIQIPLYELMDNADNIDSFSVNISSNNGAFGTIIASIGLSTIEANGGWYQEDFNLNLNNNSHSMEILIADNIDMNIDNGILQVGYWYGEQQAIILENITVYYSASPIVTTETTTATEVTTETTTETDIVTEITTETEVSTETTTATEVTTETTTETDITTETTTETEVTTETTTETEEENPSEIIIDTEETTNWSISILLNKPNQDEIISSMDFNNDEVINVFDLIYLKKHRLGI